MMLDYTPTERRHAFDGIDICTFSAGSGPAMIFAHGITANARVWDPIAAHFADRWHVVALDQRGHGRSGRPAGNAYGSADYAGDLAALIREVSEGPAVLVGHSLGGRNVMATAALYPELVRAVVCLDFAPSAGAFDFDLVAERMRRGLGPQPDRAAVDANLEQRFPLIPKEGRDRRRDHGYRVLESGEWLPLADPDALSASFREVAKDGGWDMTMIRAPLMVLLGTLEGSVTAEGEAAIRAARPDVAPERMAGTDHFLHEEKPAEVSARIEAFLTTALPS